MGELISREELAAAVAALRPRGRRTLLVAIDGWGGSGKTTLARWLVERHGGTTVCSDDFARPGVPGWEWERFDEQVLSPIRIECPYELRLARGIERDGEAMRDVWVTQWIPEEERFVRDQRPHERADYSVLGYDTDGTRFIRP